MFQSYLNSIKTGFATLLFPPRCVACTKSGLEICETCIRYFKPEPRILHSEKFKLVASLEYNDTVARILLLAKEQGRAMAQRLIANALAHSVASYQISYPISLVIIPSQMRSIRRRGFNSMLSFAELTLENPLLSQNFQVIDALEFNRKTSDQTHLSQSERSNNLYGAFRVKDIEIANPVLVIDDVVTTGSTLREAVRALGERNLTIIGAATACATQRRLAIG